MLKGALPRLMWNCKKSRHRRILWRVKILRLKYTIRSHQARIKDWLITRRRWRRRDWEPAAARVMSHLILRSRDVSRNSNITANRRNYLLLCSENPRGFLWIFNRPFASRTRRKTHRILISPGIQVHPARRKTNDIITACSFVFILIISETTVKIC